MTRIARPSLQGVRQATKDNGRTTQRASKALRIYHNPRVCAGCGHFTVMHDLGECLNPGCECVSACGDNVSP